MRVALLVTHIRAEEKLILSACNNRDISPDIILDRELNFNISEGPQQLAPSGIAWRDYDMVFERCVSTSRGMYALAILNSWGVRTFNTYETAAICGDKLRTSIALTLHGIPQPHTRVAFTPESAMQAIEIVEYPAVLKPVTGSWGRLLARVHNRDSAEAILEHRQTLGGLQPPHLLRSRICRQTGSRYTRFCGGYPHNRRHLPRIQPLDHNTARGGLATNCPVTESLNEICVRAAKAVGGGILAIDLLEDAAGKSSSTRSIIRWNSVIAANRQV